MPADVWFIKTDYAGNVKWNKTYGGAEGDYPTALLQLPDENFVIAGGSSSYTDHSEDFWLIKIDNDGNVMWNQTYGTENPDSMPALVQTFDSGFALAGYTHTDSLSADFLLIKADNQGNILWNKTYPGGAALGLPSIIQTPNGSFVLSGGKESFETGDWDFWLIKTGSYDNSGYDLASTNGSIVPPTSPSANHLNVPTSEPTTMTPEFPIWIILPVIIMLALAVIEVVRKRCRNNQVDKPYTPA